MLGSLGSAPDSHGHGCLLMYCTAVQGLQLCRPTALLGARRLRQPLDTVIWLVQDNKCSWLVVQALAKASPEQRSIIEVQPPVHE